MFYIYIKGYYMVFHIFLWYNIYKEREVKI